MGYRIGYQCFVDSETAHDWLLSQQPPTITAEGQLIRPIKQGKDWYLNGAKIELSFPECSIPQQIAEGGLFAFMLVMLASLVFLIKQIKRLIESAAWREEHD